MSELQLHEQFLLRDVPLPEVVADGKHTFNDPLAILLASKGVPDQSVQERAQMVRDKLGVAQIQQILTSSNPWASLKAAASKPGRMFRLITEDEQKEYVNQRAKTKHGAKLSNVKQKKQALQLRQQPTQLDPDHFQLDSQHFQDADGNPVKQILFQDVETDQAGIAFCTTNLAKHFLENPKSISMHGLALLLTDNPPQSVITAAGLTPMVFPALCTCTDEHTIIMGHVMQLGDSVVTRKMAGKESEPDKIETQVVKLQVYHDQLEMDWLSFSQSPVRHIINMMDAMKLCKGQNCGIDCPKHHPGLDENLDGVILQVWSRSFLNDMGKKVEPAQALLHSQSFSDFLNQLSTKSLPQHHLDYMLNPEDGNLGNRMRSTRWYGYQELLLLRHNTNAEHMPSPFAWSGSNTNTAFVCAKLMKLQRGPHFDLEQTLWK